MRSLWKGAISFGLVHIPCRLYTAASDHDVRFRQLHAECHTPLEYRRTCPHCDRRVEQAEIARGYEVAPGEFVLVDDADLERLPLPSRHVIEILDFVDLASVDPLHYERPYYVGPGEGGGRPYALLRAALRQTARAAVAQVALRAKESLALLRVVGEALVLELMRYPDEIRDWRGVDGLPAAEGVPPRELEVAVELVERRTAPWEPQRYRDAYRDALDAVIADKAAGARVSPPAEPAPDSGRYSDLLAALEASVRQAEAASGRAADPGPGGEAGAGVH